MTPRVLMVADASAVAAALGPSQVVGDWAAETLTGARLAAPHLMPFEAGSVLRKMRLSGVGRRHERRFRTP